MICKVRFTRARCAVVASKTAVRSSFQHTIEELVMFTRQLGCVLRKIESFLRRAGLSCRFLTGFHALLVERDGGGADAAAKSFGMMIEPGIDTAKLCDIEQ